MRFFVTGTDTGVGKTWFTAWLVRAWRRAGWDAVALKPIATGDRADAEALRAAMDGRLSLDEINPWHFKEPAAPLVAAQLEGRALDLGFDMLNRHVFSIADRFPHTLVEGVGGWRVPLGPGYDVRDWARDLGFPVVVVARGTLGTLNHTLLTVESITAAGATCAGVVLNAGAPGSAASPDFDLVFRRNAGLLRGLLALPVLEFDRRVEAAGDLPLWLGGK
jgi:dethiobiotin synthetase